MAHPQTQIFVSSEINDIYAESIRDLRTDLGRHVDLFFEGDSNKCVNCLVDDINNTSTGIYSPLSPYPSNTPGPFPFTGGTCPLCSGVGAINTNPHTSGVQVLLRRLRDRDTEHEILGKRQYINYRAKADVLEFDAFSACKYVTITDDDVRTEVVGIRKRGLKNDVVVQVDLKRSDNAGNKAETVLR